MTEIDERDRWRGWMEDDEGCTSFNRRMRDSSVGRTLLSGGLFSTGRSLLDRTVFSRPVGLFSTGRSSSRPDGLFSTCRSLSFPGQVSGAVQQGAWHRDTKCSCLRRVASYIPTGRVHYYFSA